MTIITPDADQRKLKDATHRLIEAIDDLIALDSIPWPERRDFIAMEASRKQWDNIHEFLLWFPGPEADDDDNG